MRAEVTSSRSPPTLSKNTSIFCGRVSAKASRNFCVLSLIAASNRQGHEHLTVARPGYFDLAELEVVVPDRSLRAPPKDGLAIFLHGHAQQVAPPGR